MRTNKLNQSPRNGAVSKGCFSWFFCFFSLVGFSGCTSIQFTSSIHKQSVHENWPVKFRIEKINFPRYPLYGEKDHPFVINNMVYMSSNGLKDGLGQVAEKRYPNLFSSVGDEVPLEISIQCVNYRSSWGEAFLLEIGTVGIFGGILPLPIYDKGTLDVDVGVVVTNRTRKLGEQKFERKNCLRLTVLTPFGLIVPCENEKPKVSGILKIEAYKVSHELNMENIVDAVVKILADKGDLNGIINDYKKSLREF